MFLKPMSGIYKLVFWGICRIYARYIVKDKPADPIMRSLCGLHFLKVHGYWPHFKNPRSLSEIVWNRMLYDRDPRLTMFSDKLGVRDYVASKVGKEYLIPMLWNGDKPEEIPFEKLPLKFVIKANHGCGYNIIVKDKTQLDQAKVRRQLKKWLGENFCQDKFLGTEWAYKNIRPTIIVESFLGENGNPPPDYKFFCYSGRMEFYKVDFDRFEDHSERICDRNCNPLQFFGQGIKTYRGKFVLPENFKELVRVAESLARGIDFIRVDLYSVSGRIYFGELTCYNGGGIIKISPRKYDFLFGEKRRQKHALI
jgi:hypothetical protein